MELVGTFSDDGYLTFMKPVPLRLESAHYAGKRVEVVIKEKKGTRSLNQNAYYHGVIVPMIQSSLIGLGHDLTKDEVHTWLKGKFNSKEELNEQTGEYESFPRSTRHLNKEQFSDYVESIRRWAATFLNLSIPSPGEQITI